MPNLALYISENPTPHTTIPGWETALILVAGIAVTALVIWWCWNHPETAFGFGEPGEPISYPTNVLMPDHIIPCPWCSYPVEVLDCQTDEDALHQHCLGSDEQEVFWTLFQRGIKGKRAHAGSCPVSRYMERQFPGYDATTGLSSLILQDHTQEETFSSILPEPVSVFIIKFDNSEYPDLDEELSGESA